VLGNSRAKCAVQGAACRDLGQSPIDTVGVLCSPITGRISLPLNVTVNGFDTPVARRIDCLMLSAKALAILTGMVGQGWFWYPVSWQENEASPGGRSPGSYASVSVILHVDIQCTNLVLTFSSSTRMAIDCMWQSFCE